MTQTTENPQPGAASGLSKGVLLGGVDTKESSKPSPEAQAFSRDLLRDSVYDVAADAISYLEGIRVFTACDDIPGLRYSTTKFVLFAREIALGSRRLTGDKTGSEPTDKRLDDERQAALRPARDGS
jgi:hypothetical protein